jgi:uncharacterized protein DUF6544
MSSDELPPLVARYLEQALPARGTSAGQVRVTQTGEMVMRPGGRALRFTAVERFAIDRVAFSWEARFRVAPLVSLSVRDGYVDGGGVLSVRALGLPVKTQSGHDVAVGEAHRYLAELPWAPYALAANHELQWRELNARAVEVSTAVAGTQPTVRLEFDADNKITRCVADARPRTVDGGSVPTRWGGDLSRYETLGGMRMPTRGEVYWDLPEGRFVYWRGEITSAELLAEPFHD